MIVTETDWERIRDEFSEAEKKGLRAHIVGESICPRGVVMADDDVFTTVVKLRNLIRTLRDEDRLKGMV